MKRKKLVFIVLAFILLFLAAANIERVYYTIKSGIQGETEFNASKHTPLVIIHGYNPLYSRGLGELMMKEMQLRLSEDMNYESRGVFLENMSCSAITGKKISIRVSYLQDSENFTIDSYTKSLGEIISKILSCTQSKKVDIIAYSMGGIVARNYIKKIGSSKVGKLIMLGTPNHGGLYGIGDIADYFAEELSETIQVDFMELSENHNFMSELNRGDETPGDIDYYTFSGIIDKTGDGLVSADSVSLEGEKKHANAGCFHMTIQFPSLCPEAYEFVKEALAEE